MHASFCVYRCVHTTPGAQASVQGARKEWGPPGLEGGHCHRSGSCYFKEDRQVWEAAQPGEHGGRADLRQRSLRSLLLQTHQSLALINMLRIRNTEAQVRGGVSLPQTASGAGGVLLTATTEPAEVPVSPRVSPLPPLSRALSLECWRNVLPFEPADRYWKWQEAHNASWAGKEADQRMQRKFRRLLTQADAAPHDTLRFSCQRSC